MNGFILQAPVAMACKWGGEFSNDGHDVDIMSLIIKLWSYP